ncbi:MAG TPA: hypothetical protein VGP94_15425, partial [Tepidisphaeraceae bacterium]|nr:hypothetical protein [Tepidisphaeraceae bacterium]
MVSLVHDLKAGAQMNRPYFVAIFALLACSLQVVHAADTDRVRERLDQAKSTFQSRQETLHKDILEDLDKSENSARQIPDKNRIDQIKAQRKAFQSTGQIPSILNPQLLARIRGARTALEKEYLAARDAYLKTKQDERAEAVEKELEDFRKGIPAEPIDLLKLIDVKRDTIRGRWERSGSSIASADPGYSSIQIPFQPPREYQLEITLAKLQAGNDFQIALVAGDQRCTIVLDGNGGEVSGISAIDGQSFDNNQTTVRGSVLPMTTPVVVATTVRNQQLSVAIANNPVIDWKGAQKRLTL